MFVAAAINNFNRSLSYQSLHFFANFARLNSDWSRVELMYTHAQKLSAPETLELRRDAGKLLKHLREKAGHSQRTFAAEVGVSIYTFVSQIETGRGRIPPDQIRVWADAYGLEARQFLMMIMRFYDPETFAVLFEHEPAVFEGTAFSAIAESKAVMGGATPTTGVEPQPCPGTDQG